MMSFFKFISPKKRDFGYRPRFYDPKKEEMEERLALARNPDDPHAASKRLRLQLKRERAKKQKQQSSARRRSNLRFLIILGLLIWLTYYLMTYKMDGFIRFFLPERKAPQELPVWKPQ
jgi:hypothetical protein